MKHANDPVSDDEIIAALTNRPVFGHWITEQIFGRPLKSKDTHIRARLSRLEKLGSVTRVGIAWRPAERWRLPYTKEEVKARAAAADHYHRRRLNETTVFDCEEWVDRNFQEFLP